VPLGQITSTSFCAAGVFAILIGASWEPLGRNRSVRVTGLIVAHNNAEITPKQLDDFCRQHLAGFKTPKEFIIETEALPRTPTGKVQKFLLVERFGSQRR
jgi:acyl-CoA synthetase (AMP-forming)/AMP-acid ligase II